MALSKVRSGEVDTPEEVAKAFNKIIGHINEVDEYNDAVVAYNDDTIEKGAKNEK